MLRSALVVSLGSVGSAALMACGDDGSTTEDGGVGSGEGAGGCFATFDGVDDGLVADASGLGSADFSISAFARPQPVPSGGIAFVAGVHKDGSSNGYYLALADDAGTDVARFVSFSGSATCSPSAPLPSGGDWVHLLGSYSDGTARLFIDGSLAAESPCDAPAVDASARFTIGRSENNLFPFAGDLDDVAYYAKPTVEAFRAGDLGCESAVFRFDFEGVASVAPDACGTSLAATVGVADGAEATDPVFTCP